MSNQQLNNHSVLIAVVAGIFTGLYTFWHDDDIIRTIMLSAISTSVSFLVSYALKEIKQRLKR